MSVAPVDRRKRVLTRGHAVFRLRRRAASSLEAGPQAKSVVGDDGLFARFLSQGRLRSPDPHVVRGSGLEAIGEVQRGLVSLRGAQVGALRSGELSKACATRASLDSTSWQDEHCSRTSCSDVAKHLVDDALHPSLVQLGIVGRGNLALLFRLRSELLQGRRKISAPVCGGLSLHMTCDCARSWRCVACDALWSSAHDRPALLLHLVRQVRLMRVHESRVGD